MNVSECVNKCNDGYYLDSGTSTCRECNGMCTTCDSSGFTQCGGCKAYLEVNYYLLDTTCYSTCPDGYYNYDEDLSCKFIYIYFLIYLNK